MTNWRGVVDALWLALLATYCLAGLSLATFHGDEAMHIYTSHDYVTAFVERQPQRLTVRPPYHPDSDQHLRLLNGSVTRYAIGLSWRLAGLSERDLPPPPGWDWPNSYAVNRANGHLPLPALLAAARRPSALFLAVSVAAMFGLGRRLGGRGLAYLASGLYAVNPVVLLAGRRAMTEGALLCFGLATVLTAATISGRHASDERTPLGWWVGLGVLGGLALASKHSGVVFLAVAAAWLMLVERGQSVGATAAKLALSLVLALAVFVALSPALWSSPLARWRDLVAERRLLVARQVAADPLAPTDLGERAVALLTDPFVAPVRHTDSGDWDRDPAFMAEVIHYRASVLSGLPFGSVLGVPLTVLAGWGVVVAVRRRQWGLVVWLTLTAATILLIPLPWQRYALPLVPVTTLLAGLGIQSIGGWTITHWPTAQLRRPADS
jgi:Dolichyl-phosphate-mannose-protein mannosyltransferase